MLIDIKLLVTGEINVMQIFLSMFLIYAIVPLALSLMLLKVQGASSDSSYTFKRPNFFVAFGIFGMLAGLTVCCILWFSPLEEVNPDARTFFLTVMTLFYGGMFFVGLWLTLHTLNWKLVLDEEFMIYKNFIGVTRRMQYEEISQIKVCKDKAGVVKKYKI